MVEEWRGVLNTILYGLIFKPALDEQAVDTMARRLIARRLYRQPTQYYYDTIKYALGLDVPLNSGMTQHSQDEIRVFFQRLLTRLDEHRPWPEPPYLKQDIALWETFSQARPIATINETELEVRGWLREIFDPLPTTSGHRRGLILRLRSGQMVALLAPPTTREEGVVMLQREANDVKATVADFCTLTGFAPDKITILPAP